MIPNAQIEQVKKEVIALLKEGGAKAAHYPLLSSRLKKYHTNLWIRRDALLSDPSIFKEVFNVLESKLSEEEKKFEAIIGLYPNSAPLIELFSNFFSEKYGRFIEPFYVYITANGRIDFSQVNKTKGKGIKKFLLISDILLSGDRALEIERVVSACKGQLVGSLAMVDMTRKLKGFPISQNGTQINTKSLLNSKDLQKEFGFYVWDSEDGNGGCPLCVEGKDYIIPPL